MIPLNNPDISELEKEYVNAALASSWVSTSGPEVTEFENRLNYNTGASFAVALNSGTSALHLALVAAGLKAGELAILPNLAYVASRNAIAYTGAEPFLLDVNQFNGQLDPVLLEKFLTGGCEVKGENLIHKKSGKIIRCVIPLWAWGRSCNPAKIVEICNAFQLPVIEDAAAAMGSNIGGKHAGTFGLCGIISFNGNKIMTTGGGGAVITNDEKIAGRVKHISLQAKVPDQQYLHDETGYNHRMINIAAALGLAQLKRMPEFLKKKEWVESVYRKEFHGIEDFQIFPSGNYPAEKSNRWVNLFRSRRAGELWKFLREREIEAGHIWLPLNRLPMNAKLEYYQEMDHSWGLHNSVIALPSSCTLTENEVQMVVDAVKKFYK